MNVLIFGGAGFIGSNLINNLMLNSNVNILCVDNLTTGRISNIYKHKYKENFLFLQADITDNACRIDIEFEIDIFLKKHIDHIYNFACPASPSKYQIDPLKTIRTSLAVDWICEIAYKYNAVLLHSSTSEVYGDPDIWHRKQDETYNGNVVINGPRSCYDEGKRVAETIIYEWTKKGVKSKVIRIFNTYGPNMDPKDGRVISNFICQALQNKPITIYGSGKITRSFQYIDDLIDAIYIFMNHTDSALHGPVNIGNPNEFTLDELAEKVLALIPESTSQIIYIDAVKDDPQQRCPDISLANNILFNWYPRTNLDDGLKKTIEYFREELKKIDN